MNEKLAEFGFFECKPMTSNGFVRRVNGKPTHWLDRNGLSGWNLYTDDLVWDVFGEGDPVALIVAAKLEGWM
jgi:hypothetical protein